LYLTEKVFEAALLNIVIELKENMIKEVKSRASGVAQVVEHLPRKCSKPSTTPPPQNRS
jgi:hypothetical protein